MKPPHFPRIIRTIRSPPARGRGLKHAVARLPRVEIVVAPRAGAWIETHWQGSRKQATVCRPPRGGVD